MRPEEDQIAEIKERLEDLSLMNCCLDFSDIQDWIIEAERRAEERVRAEIARLRDLLERLRDVVSRGMTQSVPIPGQQYPIGSHHHPIWAEIHNALEGTEA